jgi:glucokinase
VPGLVDATAGRWLYSVNLGARDLPLVDALAARVDAPTALANDVAAAAVGEAAGGTLALLQLGTGVAGRLMLDGRPAGGGTAGEVGHLVAVPAGRKCTCGLRGCVEAYAGWGPLRTLAGPNVRSPVQLPERLLDGAFEAVAIAAAAFVAVADPGVIRLGGGVSAALGERLAGEVRRRLTRLVLSELATHTRVELSSLGDRAALVGLERIIATGAA